MIKSGKIFTLVLLVLMLVSSVSALSVFAQFENGQQSNTINNGQSSNYNVAAIADQDTQWVKVTGKLYKVVNNDVVLVKTLFSETSYNRYYYPPTKILTQNDYQDAGSYMVDVLAEQKWNDGSITARSTQLYLEVSSSNVYPVADFYYVPLSPTTLDHVTFISNSTDDGNIVLTEWFVNDVKFAEGITATRLFNQAGTYSIKVKVMDDSGAQSEKTKSISVAVANTNNAPVMQPIPNQEILETAPAYIYNLQVSDPDNDPLTCYKVTGPSWILVDSVRCFVYATSIPQVNQDTSFNIGVGVSDGQATDQKAYVLKVLNVVQNIPPVANFSFTPLNPNVGQNVVFDASSSYDSNGNIVSYAWNFNDGTSASGIVVNKAFSSPGVYAVQLTVIDNDGASNSISKNVAVSVPSLLIDELFCNPDVVVGHHQHCSAHVAGNISGVTISFKLSQGNVPLGQCETNNKGYCHITPTISLSPGDYEVYAEASKTGYLSDLSRNLRTTFKVWEKRYDIRNLKVYEDAFITENYTFYRNNSMYVDFVVFDLINNQQVSASQGLLDHVFLRVNNAYILNFSRYAQATPDEYKYYLNAIPISDDFLGQGNVYSFVFNFSDNTAGQEDVVVTILNNPLMFNPPSYVLLQENSSIILDMNSYLSDVETPINEILLNYSNTGSLVFEVVSDKVFRIFAPLGFSGNQSVMFTADDTDGSVISRTILFSVESITYGPVAILDMPETTSIGSKVVLNASRSRDLDGGSITSYAWSVWRGNELIQSWITSTPVSNFKFDLQGQHHVYLVVTSSSNNSGSVSEGLYVGRTYTQTVVGKEDGLFVENVEVIGHDWGVVYLDDAFTVRATVNNQRGTMKNLRLTFAVPELGFVVKSDSFTLRNKETKDVQFYVELPFSREEVPAGEYIALIGVSDSDIIRNKYFPLLIE